MEPRGLDADKKCKRFVQRDQDMSECNVRHGDAPALELARRFGPAEDLINQDGSREVGLDLCGQVRDSSPGYPQARAQ